MNSASILKEEMMKKQIVVIGLNRLGQSIAKTLVIIGHEVLALDDDETRVQEISPHVTHAVQTDPTSESALRELGVGNFDIGVIALPNIEQSVIATIMLRKLGVRFIIAQATNDAHGIILGKIGADKIVYPEAEMGAGIAYTLTLGNVLDYIPVTSAYGVAKMVTPNHYFGKSLAEIGFGRTGRLEVVVLLIQRNQDIIISPSTTELVKPGDVLVVSGLWTKLDELFSLLQKTEK
jgi:trk system potassium uptake protein TrkA